MSQEDAMNSYELFFAIRDDNLSRVEELMETGVYASIDTSSQLKLVVMAAVYNRLDILKVMNTHGASMHVLNENGATLLDTAVQWGYVGTADWLLGLGVRSRPAIATLFHMAAANGDPRMLELLLRRGEWSPNARDSQGKTPLHYLAGSYPGAREKTSAEYMAFMERQQMKNPPPIQLNGFDAKGTVEVLIRAGADWTLKGRVFGFPLASQS
jgi:hypothetical protein